jgi:hypothetical protein
MRRLDYVREPFFTEELGMDAAQTARSEEKLRLMDRLSEIMIDEQRAQGTFDQVPHFSTLEQAARSLGQQLSRNSQRRAAAEVAATGSRTVDCPICKDSCVVEVCQRTVASLDGPFDLTELKAHCSPCRRDFFPSA